MDNNPETTAAAPATEATTPNIEATSTEQTSAPVETTPTANIPTEQIEAFNKFVDANGGFEKAFAKLKSDVSTPQKTEPEIPAPTPKPAEQVATQPQPQPFTDGISMEEFMTQQYFNNLSNREEYVPIAEQIRDGSVLKEMDKFGIKLVRDGRFNDRQINDFLSMYAKTIPPKPTSTPNTTTPTVEYANVGEKITSMADARLVATQKGHPLYKDAIEFMRDNILKK